jgi:hypothetical protein
MGMLLNLASLQVLSQVFFSFPSITIKSQIAGGICLGDIVRNADIACICERIGTWNLCQTNFHQAKSWKL